MATPTTKTHLVRTTSGTELGHVVEKTHVRKSSHPASEDGFAHQRLVLHSQEIARIEALYTKEQEARLADKKELNKTLAGYVSLQTHETDTTSLQATVKKLSGDFERLEGRVSILDEAVKTKPRRCGCSISS